MGNILADDGWEVKAEKGVVNLWCERRLASRRATNVSRPDNPFLRTDWSVLLGMPGMLRKRHGQRPHHAVHVHHELLVIILHLRFRQVVDVELRRR